MGSSTEVDHALRPSFELGRRLGIPPIPPDPSQMRVVGAGPLVFGVEPREINDAVFDQLYDPEVRATTSVAELRPGAGTDDGGTSIHVFDAATMTEHLRFDCFDENPHYHYQCPGADHVVVTFDSAAHGPMLAWVLERVRHGRLAAMLRYGGAPQLAEQVEHHRVAGAAPSAFELADALAEAAASVATARASDERGER